MTTLAAGRSRCGHTGRKGTACSRAIVITHPEPAEVITAELLCVAGMIVTGVDIDELDTELITGPRHGDDKRQATAQIEFTVTGIAEPPAADGPHGVRPGHGHRCAGPGYRPGDGPARGPWPG